MAITTQDMDKLEKLIKKAMHEAVNGEVDECRERPIAKVIYKEPSRDWEPRVFVTHDGAIGMNYYGRVVIKTIERWVKD